MTHKVKILLTILVGIAVFMQDKYLPLGVAGGVPYVAFVLMGLWYEDPKTGLYLGIVGTGLTLLGLYVSPAGGEHWKVLLNRTYAIFAIWIVAIGVYQQKKILRKLKVYAGKLMSYNKELEQKVTERTSELAEALEHQKELSEMKSRFVSVASHEFRTPLSSILSSISILGKYSEADLQKKKEKHIDRIRSSVKNITHILDDFLSLEKLKHDKTELKTESFDLPELCDEVVDEVFFIKKPGQKINYHHTGTSTVNNLDRKVLRNVITNLLSNAIKFSDENKPIDLLTAVQDGQITIVVKDEGIGISKDESKHVFGIFFRARNAEHIQGTGLGLNIVKRHVEMMGGTIDFKSELGKGSAFTLHFT